MQVQIEQRGDETRLHIPAEVAEVKITRHGERRTLLAVSEHGFGKRTPIADYRNQKRAVKGIKTMNCTDKTGCLVKAVIVTDADDVMIITEKGKIIRVHVNGILPSGRNTQGVKLVNLDPGDTITGVVQVPNTEEIV